MVTMDEMLAAKVPVLGNKYLKYPDILYEF